MAGDDGGESPLEVPALAVLVIDLGAVPGEAAHRRRALVGHHHGTGTVDQGGDDGQAGDHGGHRDVAIDGAAAVELQETGVEGPGHRDVGQPGHLDGADDGGRVAHAEEEG